MSLDVTLAIASAVIGYIAGSLSFGYWIAKAKGVDIFAVGSRNPGATNVKRSVGSKAGNLVFILDFVKGLLATGWPLLLHGNSESGYVYGLIGLFAAVLGHSFSIFTGFRGGKGVATMLGGVAALMPLAALIGAVVWLILFYATRYVSVASIALALSLPIANWLSGQPSALLWVSVALAIVVIYRHKSNIIRLIKGQENRFERKKSARDSSEQSETTIEETK